VHTVSRSYNTGEAMRTINDMPNQPREGRTARGVRIDDSDWEALGEIAEALDLDRGWIIRQLIRKYLGRPGADLPELPKGGRGDPARRDPISGRL
jgi:hypothetical protein